MYKKIYLEITNKCNLNCDFCIHNKRKKETMSLENFKIILNKIKHKTNYLYFHVLGEPLIHPNINDMIDIASKDFNINITTNGYFINRIKQNKNIRQINISLHSFDKNIISLKQYMENIFDAVDILSKVTYISYRIWINNENTKEIISLLNQKYNTNIDLSKRNITLDKNIFLSVSKKFIWPDLENEILEEQGKCYALRDHIGILVDGTVVPCCLDSKGIINLGNILNENLEDIINKDRYQNMLKGFNCHEKREELCKKCKFL